MSQTRKADKLAALEVLKRELDRIQYQIDATVTSNREDGTSWAAIGAELGISKQAAQQKYGKRNTSQDHNYTTAENQEADKALEALQAIAARQNEAEKLKADDEQTPTTPSIFLEAPAPAKKKAAPKLPKFAKAYGDEYPKTRPVYELPGTPPTTAQPGTGKGKHQCPSCGDTNHHGPKRGTVAMFADCTPTKYDPPATHDYMNGIAN